MWTPTLVLIAVTTLVACALLGGGLYETVVVDPAWPKRPGIIQAQQRGHLPAPVLDSRAHPVRGAADRRAHRRLA